MPQPSIAHVTPTTSTLVAGLAGTLGGATLMFPTPDPDQPGNLAFNTCNVVAFILLIMATVGLWRLGAAGRGWLGRIGLVTASAALAGFAMVEFATRYDPSIGESIHPITVPTLALGMTAAGVAVIRAGRWRGWVRVTPLLCGAVPLAVELPVFVLLGPIDVVISLTWATWVLLGLAEVTTAIGGWRATDDLARPRVDQTIGG